MPNIAQSLKRAIIDARNTVNMSQQKLSQRADIAQSDISKLENGNANPYEWCDTIGF